MYLESSRVSTVFDNRFCPSSFNRALDQLTSSQQALPNHLPSQGLYALLLVRAEAGVRSLPARSFKVRHGMRRWKLIEDGGVMVCTWIAEIISWVQTLIFK